MIIHDFFPSGVFLVSYLYQGEPAKYVTIDQTAAEKYAARWHGTVEQLYRRASVNLPEECSVKQLDVPKESTDSNGTTAFATVLLAESGEQSLSNTPLYPCPSLITSL